MKKIIIALLIIFASQTTALATTDTFNITNANNNGRAYIFGSTSYPPSGAASFQNGDAATLNTSKSRYYDGGYKYYIYVALLKFDTSTLPDNATISSASLQLYLYNKTDSGDGRNINGDYGSWTGADGYSDSIGTTAFSFALSDVSSGATRTITLNNINNISKTGTSYFRIGISGDSPTGNNSLGLGSYGTSSGGAAPVLSITYTVPTPPGIPGNPTFTNVANKSMTISWTAATGATSYTLQRNGSNISTNATSPYNDSGLSVATSYTYRVIAVNADGSTNCAADQSQTTTYWSKKMNGSTVKKINGTYVDKVNGL